MRICVYLPACPCSKEQGGGGEEKGYASRERRNKNTMTKGAAYTMALMTLCQMEPHPEPGTVGLSDTPLIFRLASVSPSTVRRDTATKKRHGIFSPDATT
ncbi:unnamed protein product [Lasius platythorax]|uniref:Uncharacterized protein n=1 Tax=Lasius platythorax TaxID=488582 RepID=A0AAV2NEA4_9HYME